MDVPARVVHPLLILAVVLAAVVGYIAGDHHASPSTAERAGRAGEVRVASGSGLLLEYPTSWVSASDAPSIPGLTLGQPLALAPRGGSGAGLLSGTLPTGEASPLPASLLARLSATPKAEVVDLVSAQAYRYTDVRLPGFKGALELYVVPAAGAPPRLLACYAPSAQSRAAVQCRRIVASVTLSGAAAPAISPEAGYAVRLSAILTRLEHARTAARGQMSHSGSATAAASPAASLAGRFASAASAVSALEAPQPASAAQTALASALHGASSAYAALGEAARTESLGEYDIARERVATAEQGVDRALQSFTLLGYGAS